MRGIISPKLSEFIEQANLAALEAKKNGVKLTPELVRGNIEKLAFFIGDGPELAFVRENAFIAPSHSIPVRVYSPAPEQALPVVIHYHGGGHLCGNIALYDTISRKIAKAGNCIVIAVEYRLAPEHPYPAGLDDCKYALTNYQQVLAGVEYNEQVIILGDSAGGAICTSLSNESQHNYSLKIDKQILIYPSVDYTMESDSIQSNGTGYLLEREKIFWYFAQYFKDNEDRQKASPLFGVLTSKLPKTLIFTCGCDPLRDEGLAYTGALTAAGVPVQHQHFSGLIHAYMLLDSLVSIECEQTYQMIGEFIKS